MPAHTTISTIQSPGHYSQTLTNGNFYFLISADGPLDQINRQFGHDLVNKIEETLLENPATTPQDFVHSFPDINLTAAKIENNKITLCSKNNSAQIIRNKKVINFPPANITGQLQENDILIFSNQSIPVKFLTPEISDTLAPFLENSDTKNFTALIIKNEKAPKLNLNITSVRRSFNISDSKKLLYLLVLFFVFLASIITFQLRSKSIETRAQTVSQIESQVNQGLTSAQKLIGLNDVLARNILTQTKTDFESKATSSFGQDWPTQKSAEIQKLLKIRDNLNSQIAQVSHIYPISQLDVFYDFSLLKNNAQIVSAEIHNNEIIALDQSNGAIYSLSVGNKSAKIVTGADTFKSAKFIDFTGDKIYVFTPDGIFLSTKNIIKPTANWTIQSLKTFGNNLYLLDPQNNQIYKYISTDFGFSDIQNYLKSGLSIDLKNVVSMAIDGNIYVLSKTGGIVRFTSGSPDEFQINGLDTPLNNPTSIYVSDETKNIYILDSNRIVVLDKKGTYQSQYVFGSKLPDPSSLLLVSEQSAKILLFSKNVVYSISVQ